MKVRVFDLDSDKMSAGFDIDMLMQNEIEIEFPETNESLPLKDFLFFRKEYSKFMLFTGLKDRSGKEVYHKDYLAFGKKIFVCEWQQEEARFILLPTIGNPDSWKFMDECNRMKIVGNTYNNVKTIPA